MATTSQVLIDFEARIQNAEKNIKKINSDIAGTGKAAEKTSKDMKSAGKSAGAFFGKLVAGAAALRGLYNATRDNIQANAKLNAIIKATGGVAGITTRNIKGIVKELQAYTGESEATIKNTSAMLLTFKNINKDIFPDTLKVTADLAAAMGTDLKSASIQVGKALNDPATGMTALVRSGITFSEEQKKLIKGFQQTNQLGKAQAIILKELQSQFGGTAAALNATPIGQVETAFNQFKDALAEIGKVVLPVFGAIVGAVGDFVMAMVGAGPVVKTAAAAIAVAVGALTGPVGLIVGLVSAVGLLGTLKKSFEDLNSEVGKTSKGFSDLSKQQQLLQTLKTLKSGTKDYEKTLSDIIKLNPRLKQTNLTTAQSFDEISNAVNRSAREQAQYLRGIAKLQLAEVTQLIGRVARDVIFAGGASQKQQKQLEQSFKLLGKAAVNAGVKTTAEWAQFSSILKQLEADGKVVGGTYNKLLASFKAGRIQAKGLGVEVQKIKKDVAKPIALKVDKNKTNKNIKESLEAEDTTGGGAVADAVSGSIVSGVTEGFGIVKQALSGDITGAIQSGLQATNTVWGQWAALGVSAVSSVIDIFRSDTESEIERIQKKFDDIVSDFEFSSGVLKSIEDFIGGATEATVNAAISGSENALDRLSTTILGQWVRTGPWEVVREEFEGLSDLLGSLGLDEVGVEFADRVATAAGLIDDIAAQNAIIAETGIDFSNEIYVNAARVRRELQQQLAGLGLFSSGLDENELQQQLGIYEEILEVSTDIQTAQAQAAILEQQKELKEINDDIRTGQVEEEDTLSRQIEIYDEMIEALDGVAGAEELILDLQEERYNLSKKINAENQLAAYYSGEQGSQLESLVSQLKQIEQDVVTGARREGTTATVGAQVGVLDSIISNLQAQGADPDLISEYQAQRAELLRGLYGEQGFQARAGTGAAVGFSVPASFAAGSSTTNNTTQNSLSINGQTFNDDTLVQRIVDEINRTYGTNILQGA